MGCTLTRTLEADPAEVPRAATQGTAHARFPHVRAVAFDLDNTLVDIVRIKTRAAEAAAWALAEAGLDEPPERMAAEILKMAFEVGIDQDDIVEQWLTRRFGRAEPRLLHLAHHAFERGEDASVVAYPRAARTLLELHRRGYALVLVTDALRPRALKRLQSSGLLPFFSDLVTLDDTGTGKVDARPYAIACERLGIEPRELLMVGDNPHRDVAEARAFGCRAVLAEYGVQESLAAGVPRFEAEGRILWLDEILPMLPRVAPAAGAPPVLRPMADVAIEFRFTPDASAPDETVKGAPARSPRGA